VKHLCIFFADTNAKNLAPILVVHRSSIINPSRALYCATPLATKPDNADCLPYNCDNYRYFCYAIPLARIPIKWYP